MNSNWFFGVALFLSFFLMWGCSKNVAPPEVETAPEVAEIPPPVVEDTAPEPEPEQGVQEEGFGIDAQQEAPVVEETFEEPEPVQEEIVEMTPEPVQEEIVEMTPEPQPEPMVEPEPEPQQEEVVEMTPEPQPEPQEEFAPEPEPVQEARIIPDFKEEKQLQDIHFEYDRDQLNSQNKEILRSNAQWLKNNPNVRVEIQGHADERGTNNYNLGLGERRALQTKKYLISQGVDESRLYTISYGEEKPFCFESNENCWWENRRAHFTVAE